MAILKIERLRKRFNEVQALDDVSFEFDHGILSFLGPSGCGKTTLLRSIAGLEVPDGGSISIADQVQTLSMVSLSRLMPGRLVSFFRITRFGRT